MGNNEPLLGFQLNNQYSISWKVSGLFFRGSFDNRGGDFPGSACAGVGVPYLTLRFGGFPSDDGQMVGEGIVRW